MMPSSHHRTRSTNSLADCTSISISNLPPQEQHDDERSSPVLALPSFPATTAAEEVELAFFDNDDVKDCFLNGTSDFVSRGTTTTTTRQEHQIEGELSHEGSSRYSSCKSNVLESSLSSSSSIGSARKPNTFATRLASKMRAIGTVINQDVSSNEINSKRDGGRIRNSRFGAVTNTSPNGNARSHDRGLTNATSVKKDELMSIYSRKCCPKPEASPVSDSDGPVLVVATTWAKRGMEEGNIMALKLRAVMVLQQPGALWTKQGHEYQKDENSTPEGSRLRLVSVVCWGTYGHFRSYLLSPDSMKYFVDIHDLAVPGTIQANVYLPLCVDRQNNNPFLDTRCRKRPLPLRLNLDSKKPLHYGFNKDAKEGAQKLKHVQPNMQSHQDLSKANVHYTLSRQSYLPFTNSIPTKNNTSTTPIFHTTPFIFIIIRIYPDPNQRSVVEQLIDSAKVCSHRYKQAGTCLMFESYRPYRSPNWRQEFLVYASYLTEDHFHQHVSSMGEESLLGDKMNELCIQQPICDQYQGIPINPS